MAEAMLSRADRMRDCSILSVSSVYLSSLSLLSLSLSLTVFSDVVVAVVM